MDTTTASIISVMWVPAERNPSISLSPLGRHGKRVAVAVVVLDVGPAISQKLLRVHRRFPLFPNFIQFRLHLNGLVNRNCVHRVPFFPQSDPFDETALEHDLWRVWPAIPNESQFRFWDEQRHTTFLEQVDRYAQ